MADTVSNISNGQYIKNETESSSTKSTKAGGELGKDAFLQLLVTQMQNQDPLNPATDTEYISQLATYSQVEELQNISTSMSNMQALSTVGRKVDITTSDSGVEKTISGTVESVTIKDGSAYVSISGTLYDAEDITNVYAE